MFERSHLSKLRLQRPGALPSSFVLRATLALSLLSPVASAQTTAPAQTTPAPATAPASTPAAPKSAVTTLPGSSNVASALGIEVSGTVKGRLVSCPKGLKVNSGAVCLYTQNTLPILRSLLRQRLRFPRGHVVSNERQDPGR